MSDRAFDWPMLIEDQAGPMEFGPRASGGPDEVFPAPGDGVFQPYYPCLLALLLPDTGESAIVGIPPGTAAPQIATNPSGKFSTTKNKGMSINIFKEGEALVFQFNLTVPALNALRIM